MDTSGPNIGRWLAKTGLNFKDGNAPKKILITSAMPGEGKSTVSRMIMEEIKRFTNCQFVNANTDVADRETILKQVKNKQPGESLVIDGAPIYMHGRHIDPIELAPHVDLTLVVIHMRRTHKSDVKRACLAIDQTGSKVGVVMNNRSNRFYPLQDKLYA